MSTARSFKKSDVSFNNSEKLSESYAQIFRKEREERIASSQGPQARAPRVIIRTRAAQGVEHSHVDDGDDDAHDDDNDVKRDAEELDADDQVDDLDDYGEDPELAAIKAKRMAELQAAFELAQLKKAQGHGECLEVTQDEFLSQVTKSAFTVCHFYHREFQRCKITDKHLALLAAKHFETKFIRIDAEKSPFFVQKLNIRVLPCVVCFIDGLAVDRLVGFEDFGNKDDFSTKRFEYRLWQAGMLDNEKGERNMPKAAPIKTLLDA